MLEAARDLYAVAPEGFIAARNQLVKELKAAGRTDDAATVAKLRRPRLAEWALNRLAHDGAESVGRFALATAAAQRAQSAAIGGDASALRAATTELRDALHAATEAAVDVVNGVGGSGEGQRDDVTAILRQLVANADPSPLVAGVVGSEAIVSTGEFFPGAPEPVARPAAHADKPKQPTKTAPKAAPDTTADKATTAKPTTASATTAKPTTAKPTTARATTGGSERPKLTLHRAPTKQEMAAVRAMERAERHGLRQRAESARKRVDSAASAVEQAQAALAERREALKTAQAAARAADVALAEFEAAHADEDDHDDHDDHDG